MAFVYDTTIDPDAENNSHAYALSMVGFNKSVLEVGCATGYFSKALVERGCRVVGIEIDPGAAVVAEKWCEHVVVGDLDVGDVWNCLPDESFEALVFGDVLEHLRDPLSALRSAVKKLKPAGVVVISLPNIAHGDVRMALLGGSFDYVERGLLDRTHVQFFTVESVRKLVLEAGLIEVELKRVIVPLFQTEIELDRNRISPSVVDEILTDPEAEVYQYVSKSVRDDGTYAVSQLADRVSELTDIVNRDVIWTALLGRPSDEAAVSVEHSVAMQRHIEALEDHARGLEANIAVLNDAFVATELRYQAVLGMKTVQLTAPLRWIYRKIRPLESRRPRGA